MKSKKLFALIILFSLQSSCMDITTSEQNQHAIQEISIFADLPHDLLPTIAAYSDCKTMAAWKQTCHKYNNTLHYHQIPTAIIECENYDMITNGLIYFANNIKKQKKQKSKNNFGFTPDSQMKSRHTRNKIISIGQEYDDIIAHQTESNQIDNIDQKNTDINLENCKNFLCNNFDQRISDIKMLGWTDRYSLKNYINTFIKAYNGHSGSSFKSFSYSDLSSDTLKRIIHINPNITDRQDQTPLEWAYEQHCIKTYQRSLANKKTTPNEPNRDNDQQQPIEIIRQLLADKRTDPNKPGNDNYNDPVLYSACTDNQLDIIKLLLANPKTKSCIQNNQYGERKTTFSLACQKGCTEIIQLLLAHQPTQENNGDTMLHQACDSGNIKTIELLLTYPEINPNAQNNDGNTALHLACKNNNLKIIKLLLQDNRINLNALNKEHDTALLIACKLNLTEVANLLLDDKRTNQNINKYFCGTPLMVALNYGSTATERLLLAHPNRRDNNGNTPLHLACLDGNITKIKELLNDPRTNLSLQNNNGKTVLDIAHDTGQTQIKDYLLTNIQDNNGNTRLHRACIKNDIKEVKRLIRLKSVAPNIQNNEGNTALLIACQDYSTEIVKLLIRHPELNLKIKNTKGLSVYNIKNYCLDKALIGLIYKKIWLKSIHKSLYYAPHVVSITLLTLLLSYFFYATTHNNTHYVTQIT